jgi:ABC-type iron transport system FetAB ATPase subunit
MPIIFEGARDVNFNHSNLTSIGQNQYNTHTGNVTLTNITYAREERDSALAALKPVDRSCYYVTPCSPGTRHWLIEKINEWLGDEEAMNILLLTGSPGAGKSTIASTLVSNLAESGRLGGQFFCKRDNLTLSNPATIWRTTAFDLAQRNNVFAGRVIENLKAGRVDLSRADIESHFKYLIEDPLMECLKENMRTDAVIAGEAVITPERITMQFPVVLIDALDECGSDNSQSIQ